VVRMILESWQRRTGRRCLSQFGNLLRTAESYTLDFYDCPDT
jgi:hypothetical protein